MIKTECTCDPSRANPQKHKPNCPKLLTLAKCVVPDGCLVAGQTYQVLSFMGRNQHTPEAMLEIVIPFSSKSGIFSAWRFKLRKGSK